MPTRVPITASTVKLKIYLISFPNLPSWKNTVISDSAKSIPSHLPRCHETTLDTEFGESLITKRKTGEQRASPKL